MDFDIVYANTRVRAMRNRLFKKNDYEAALKSKDLQEFATLLEHTGYRINLESLKDHTRENINKKLGENLIMDLERLRFLAPNSLKKLFDIFRERYELENIKTLIAFKVSDDKGDVWKRFPYPVKDHKLMTELVGADLEGAIKRLGEDYPDLGKAYRMFKEKGHVQPIFSALEKRYFERLWKSLGGKSKVPKPLGGKNAARALVGEEMDLLNLLNIRRSLGQGTDAKSFLLPKYKLDFTPMIESRHPEKFLKALEKSHYKKYMGKSLADAENEMRKHMVASYRQAIERDPFDLGVLLGYLKIKEQEVWNLMTICNSLGRLEKSEIEALIF